uniref:Pectate lyase n=1 Tax=Picea sitchensis TaxID=3332 RepID=B8LS41_PICSI|nr:unknown [Picea sitchensis]
MAKQSQLCYLILFAELICLQILAPKCSAEKTQGMMDSFMGFLRGRPTIQVTEQTQQQNSSFPVEAPDEVVKMVQKSINDSRRQLSYLSCGTGNPIDDCWRCEPNWQMNRQRLADCAIGFGRDAIGGKNGRYYVVTDSSDEDAVNPKPGTLRHAVIQDEPLWIIFQSDMVIQLKEELMMNSFKTIDGRGADVHIAHGACITIQFVTNIIIHGVSIHDCFQAGNAMVRNTPEHYGWRTVSDGDGISIFGGRYIWIDHCSLSNCKDGLIDAIMGSTAITISNNYFTHHDKVMLLGHSDSYVGDAIMQVTIAFNYFGEGLMQRMPRCRHGYFHIVNNHYSHWEMYAIGGSANPTINSEGNRFIAPDNANAKQVTKRLNAVDEEWMRWNWRSAGDLMVNGAFFVPSGAGTGNNYALASSVGAKSAFLVKTITEDAGVLQSRTHSSRSNDNTGRMSVSAAPMSILSAAHSHQIIYFFLCALCYVLTAFGRNFGFNC